MDVQILHPEKIRTDGGTFPAMTWFADCTYLGCDRKYKDAIERDCLAQGHIPIIDYDDELGWVFHTIFPPDGTVSKKSIAKRFESGRRFRCVTESDLQSRVSRHLGLRKVPHSQEVQCAAGRADIVTPFSVIEIEFSLSRRKVLEAIGQVLTYRQSIDGSLRAEIVALSVKDEAMPIVDAGKQLGIKFYLWNEVGECLCEI